MDINLITNSKGGIGKSFIAALLAQYMLDQGKTPLCIDTDPVNSTFSGYKGLGVQHLQIMEGDEIDPRKFDNLVELIAGANDDVIIDNGASSFIALANYLISTDIPALLKDMGHQLIIHTVITGGQAALDTVTGFSKLVTQFQGDVKFVVWLNPYWGAVELDGKNFTEFKAYKNNKDRVSAIVEIPTFQAQTFGRDLSDMLSAKMTFNEALKTPALSIVTRQRLTMIRREIFGRIAAIA